jgi:hypothetical protein
MVNPAESAKSRHKPATYGKSSQRTVSNILSSTQRRGISEDDGLFTLKSTDLMVSGKQQLHKPSPKRAISPTTQDGEFTRSMKSSNADQIFSVPLSDDDSMQSACGSDSAKRRKTSHKNNVLDNILAASEKFKSRSVTTQVEDNECGNGEPLRKAPIGRQPKKAPTARTVPVIRQQRFDTGDVKANSDQSEQHSKGVSLPPQKNRTQALNIKSKIPSKRPVPEEGKILSVQPKKEAKVVAQKTHRGLSSRNKFKSNPPVTVAVEDVEPTSATDPITGRFSPPRTPPRTFFHNGGSFNRAAITPGALDIPHLRISGSPSSSDESLAATAPPASQRKKKLKDRLQIAEPDDIVEVDTGPELSTGASMSDQEDSGAHSPGLVDSGSQTPVESQSQSRQKAPKAKSENAPLAGPKITYLSSRQRSHLTELDIDSADPFGIDIPETSTGRGRNSRADGWKKTADPYEIQDDVDEGNSHGPLRSIHELRKAGNNARSVGEIEGLLEDMDDSSSTLKRTSMLKLAEKLLSVSTCRQFLHNGLESRLLSHIGTETDEIFNKTLLAVFVELISQSGSIYRTVQDPDPKVLDFLCKHLTACDDLLEIVSKRSSNTSRTFQTDFKTFIKQYLKSSFWRSEKPEIFKSRTLALQGLEYIVRSSRENGSKKDILSAAAMEELEYIIAADSTTIKNSVVDTGLTLSILESISIVQPTNGVGLDRACPTRLATTLTKMIPNSYQKFCIDAPQIWSLLLRLCLNLSNNEDVPVNTFASLPTVATIVNGVKFDFERLTMDDVDKEQDLVVDNCVLSLGFLINLVEKARQADELFLSSYQECVPVDVILDLFNSRLQRAFEVC